MNGRDLPPNPLSAPNSKKNCKSSDLAGSLLELWSPGAVDGEVEGAVDHVAQSRTKYINKAFSTSCNDTILVA